MLFKYLKASVGPTLDCMIFCLRHGYSVSVIYKQIVLKIYQKYINLKIINCSNTSFLTLSVIFMVLDITFKQIICPFFFLSFKGPKGDEGPAVS